MKPIFTFKEGEGKPVQDALGFQEIIASLLDDSDQIIVILDKNVGSYYIEKVINRFAMELYVSSNFMKIEDKEEWNTYRDYFALMGIVLK